MRMWENSHPPNRGNSGETTCLLPHPVDLKKLMQDRVPWKAVEELKKDSLTFQTPSGPIQIQPQRTNNILKQFFRSLKHAHRRRTGNGYSSRMLGAMLAQTP